MCGAGRSWSSKGGRSRFFRERRCASHTRAARRGGHREAHRADVLSEAHGGRLIAATGPVSGWWTRRGSVGKAAAAAASSGIHGIGSSTGPLVLLPVQERAQVCTLLVVRQPCREGKRRTISRQPWKRRIQSVHICERPRLARDLHRVREEVGRQRERRREQERASKGCARSDSDSSSKTRGTTTRPGWRPFALSGPRGSTSEPTSTSLARPHSGSEWRLTMNDSAFIKR